MKEKKRVQRTQRLVIALHTTTMAARKASQNNTPKPKAVSILVQVSVVTILKLTAVDFALAKKRETTSSV